MGSSSSDTGGSRRRDPALAPGSVVAERFEVADVAGAGGMGTVYKVRDRATGMLCALKVLRGEGGDPDRFQREAEVLSQVRHPHVVGYVAHGTTAEGDPFLAMDWLAGDALKDFLAKRRLTPREAAHLGRAVASALAAAHEKGVVHRDLKPSNLVVSGVDGTSIGSVKVLDFGVARLRDLDRDLTRTGQVIGTPGYMAPEQARGEKDVDERADLFSLGCVLYRSIVGRPAFDGEDVLAVLTLLVLHDPPRIGELVDGVPDALDDLVTRLLEKDKKRRPESAQLVAAELERIAALPDAAYARSARGVPAPARRAGDLETATNLGRTLPDGPSASGTAGASASGSRSIEARSVASPAPPRRALAVVAAVAVLLGGGVAAAIVLLSKAPDPPRSARSASAVVAPQPPAPKSLDELAKEASSRGRAWGPLLTRMRDAGGAFGLETQRTPGGWETGQAVMAWGTAARACDFETSERLPESLAALEKLKRAVGWGSSDVNNPTQSFAGANGWVLLGLVAANAKATTPELQRQAAFARASVLLLQNPTGTFRFKSDSKPNTEEDYSSMIATWALVESDWLEPAVPARDARTRGVAALRAYLTNRGGDPPVETVDGYEEQMAWVILRDRKKGGEQPPTDRELFEKVAKDLVGRCANQSTVPGETACANAGLSANSHLEPDPNGREYFRTFWLPWAALLAYELARDTTIGLSPETRAKVEGVARWTLGKLGEADPRTMTAVYQVAEYVFAASMLGLPDPSIPLSIGPQPPIVAPPAPGPAPTRPGLDPVRL